MENQSVQQSTPAQRVGLRPGRRQQARDEETPDQKPAALGVESDRFRPSRLEQVGGGGRGKTAKGQRRAGGREETFRQKPIRLIDRALLVVEVVGALVVAWLVVQYVYTVYFDTAPRRATPRSGAIGGQVAGAAKRSPTSVPTRFVEVAPPLIGGPEETITLTATPTPTVPLEMRLPTRLRIPAMSLDSPVHEVNVNMGTWEVSPMDIGHHTGTGNPGEPGNVVLAGHRDINSALFRELDRLGPGDEVFVSNSLGEHRYVVQESLVVSPDHVEVMDPTDDSRVTLITCTPIGLATQRLVVTAVLDESTASR